MSKNQMATCTKNVNERLDGLQAMVETFKNSIMTNMPSNEEEYIRNYRFPINVKMIEIATGCSYGVKETKKNGDMHFIKFNTKGATNEQLLKLSTIIRNWIDFEESIFDRVDASWHTMTAFTSGGENMTCEIDHFQIQVPEKINSKNLTNLIIGNQNENIPGILAMYLDDINIQELAAVGEKIRKHRRMLTWVFIGIGAAVVIGAGTAAAIAFTNAAKHRNDDETENGDNVDVTDDVEIDVDIDDIAVDDEPVVEMEFSM